MLLLLTKAERGMLGQEERKWGGREGEREKGKGICFNVLGAKRRE